MNEPIRWLTDPDAPPDAEEVLRFARPTRDMTHGELARSARRLGLGTAAAATTVISFKGTAVAGLIGAVSGLVLSTAVATLSQAPGASKAATTTSLPVPRKANAARVVAAPTNIAPMPTAPTAAPVKALQVSEESDTLGQETALLDQARGELGRAPTKALALLSDHATRFPKGKLGFERELLRVDALKRSNKRVAALRLAKQLRLRAGALYQARLSQLIEELEPTAGAKRNLRPAATAAKKSAPAKPEPTPAPAVPSTVPKASFDPAPR